MTSYFGNLLVARLFLDEKSCKISIRLFLNNPLGPTVNHFPIFSFRRLYYTTWGPHCQIIQANMDGTNRSAITSPTLQLNWPNGLVVDKTLDRLYWTDLGAVSSIGLDGMFLPV